LPLVAKAHSVGRCVCIGLGVCVLTLLFAGDTVALPQLLTGTARDVDVALLLASAYAPLAARCFGGESLRMEATARRSLGLVDFALLCALAAPVGAIVAIAAVGGDEAFVLNVTRNFAAFIAASLLLLTIAGQTAAAAVPVVYVLVISIAGASADGTSPWWASLRQPATGLSTTVALCLAAAALAVFHRWARYRPHAGLVAA